MKARIMFILLPLLLASLLAGCSDRGDQAQERLAAARAARQQQDLDQAEDLLGKLIREFPQSQAAAAARNELQALRGERQAAVERLDELLDRLASVLDGYQAFSGTYPASLQDLDRGTYFFDLAYLRELVPSDLKVLVLFGEEREPYRLWAANASLKTARQRGAGNDRAQTAAMAALTALEADYRSEAVAENILALHPKSVARGG